MAKKGGPGLDHSLQRVLTVFIAIALSSMALVSALPVDMAETAKAETSMDDNTLGDGEKMVLYFIAFIIVFLALQALGPFEEGVSAIIALILIALYHLFG